MIGVEVELAEGGEGEGEMAVEICTTRCRQYRSQAKHSSREREERRENAPSTPPFYSPLLLLLPHSSASASSLPLPLPYPLQHPPYLPLPLQFPA